MQTGEIPNALLSHRAGVGFGHHIHPTNGCALDTIGKDELYVVLRGDLTPGSGTAVDLAALEDLPLLRWPREHNPEYHDALLETCRQRGLDPLILTGCARISG